MCNNDGQCMSESLRELINLGIDAYENELQMEKETKKSTCNPPRPELKNVRISYDGKTWYDLR